MTVQEQKQSAMKRQQLAKREIQGLKVVAVKVEDYPKVPKKDVLYVLYEEV